MQPSRFIEDFSGHLRYELRRSPCTVEAYCRDVKEFSGFISPKPVEETLSVDIREWLAALAETEKPRSLRRKTQSLRAFFRFLMKKGVMASNPAADIILAKLDHPLPEFVKTGELEGLIEIMRKEARRKGDADTMAEYIAVTLLYATGIRQAELLSLRDADVDTGSAQIKVTGKRNKQRVLPLSPALCEEIEGYRAVRRREYPEEEGSGAPFIVLRGRALTKSQLYRLVHEALECTSAHKKSPHVLRHTFATCMLSGGASLEGVQEFLGHTSVATTQIYTHVSMAELRKSYLAAHPRAKTGNEKDPD